MKKYSFLPILALVLGIAASAFTVKPQQPHSTDQWFYTLSSASGQNLGDNYELLDDQDVTNCRPVGSINCVIQADEDPFNPGHPDMSSYTVVSKKQ